MRSRSLLLLTCSVFLAAQAHAQLQRIVLQGSGAPQVFTELSAAIVAAQPNDKLYFSGGTFTADSSVTVDIPLHFIGAGISPDSSSVTGVTTISTPGSEYFIITTGGSGSTFTGIRFALPEVMYYGWDATNDDPTGLVFERCIWTNTLAVHNNSNPGASSSVFNECIFQRHLYGQSGTLATLNRCVLDYNPGTGTTISGFHGGALTLSHCVLLTGGVGNSGGCTIENCIFTSTSAPVWQSSGAIITNNLVVSAGLWSNMTPGSYEGNVTGVDVTTIFISEDNTDFNWYDDLHLQPSSVGIGMATDGSDVGIYGTNSPFKPGAVPYNPHFRSATIAPATSPNGDLPVNIRVAAQTN